MIAQLLFLYFSAVILGSALLAISLRNMIYSALSLLVTLIHVAGIYVLLNAEFVAAVQIIVYAGAILVLYLFVLMIFNVKLDERVLHLHYPLGIFLGLVVLAEMVIVYWGSGAASVERVVGPAAWNGVGNTQALGTALYTRYLFPFELASVILLVAMVGAIALGKRINKPASLKTSESANGKKTLSGTPVDSRVESRQ